MSKVYYEKVGRKYVQCAEYDNEMMESFPIGATLVIVEPYTTMKLYKIDPAVAPLIAAGQNAKDAMASILMEELALQPYNKIKTPEQQKAIEQVNEAFGDDRFPLQWPSVRMAVEAGMKVLYEEANETLTNPAVKNAYENFLLVYKLTKEENDK